MSNKLIDLIDIWSEWMWKDYYTSYFGRIRDTG